MTINFTKRAQIKTLSFEKAFTIISAKYLDYNDVFLIKN